MRLLLLIALLAVAGCGSAAAPADPAALVGRWQVDGTDQQVRLDPAALEVTAGCGTIAGTWRADPAGRFVAGVDSAEGCAEWPGWIAAAGGFRIDGDARVLLDRAGAEVARLVPVAGSVAPATAGRAVAPPAAPVPAGSTPADLPGRWAAGPGAVVEFALDGSWSGSDGCNGAGGSWAAGPDGGFLATAGSVRTLMACDAPVVDVGYQVGEARWAVLDGAELVLLDADAAELGRFTESP